jgi:phosphoribosylaminoimidazole-succinocarboxamide synthase
MSAVISQTDFAGLNLRARGKVRDIYELGDQLLIVATDRLSAFDVVLPTPIPDKGRVLTQLSLYWFEKLASLVPNHVISASNFTGALAPYADALKGRAMLVRRTEPVQIECVVRGYISGSGWKDYQKTGSICGIALPSGLRDTSLAIYKSAAEFASARGIIIADTKFEFGLIGDELIWIDEALTPDSSRFWPGSLYMPGKPQPSFDKQYVRDYLEKISWNKQPPAPALPPDVVAATTDKYREAYQRVTGHALD